ncbi:conserved Plasmodium protein, unknown function [Plasmodium yoelii]|uniref:Uncharacterized protein n=3 Tax=Plasmodium yoelii TaxID=5861 RepID=A0AAE9WM40_PLAYO|nr:conserved Plasmodium protein, unknown function [Plasmodium yoelii]WBY56587.1 hypothetical protein Py17XNL_000801651 [Plasmodium yoelii yoelii]CDU17446.1 conserved Plasmodium protein, unknown function [Plasmodium yoelii]VTZ77168.1 conserved Plasmodium protein, unknown function [Plasmodium yoelii]|eukprot:XP_729159.2 conserved Plasmodium protein, unknown function [Plasmodium yoelii]
MSITIKESLEHVCNVLNYFGIEYITPEILRRGKNNKKVQRRKVIIKYTFLINDLCLLYFFDFKRKFKPTYNEYIKNEILKVEKLFIKNNKQAEDELNKREDDEYVHYNHSGGVTSSCDHDAISCDDEDYFFEELGEDVHYFDDFYLISPIVVLLLEYFEYPRLYQLIKCNFQMAKELLLCIGFMFDCFGLFEHYDKKQPFYETFFRKVCDGDSNSNMHNLNKMKGKNALSQKNIKKNNDNDNDSEDDEEYKFYHVINEAMLMLSNRPHELEIFGYKHFYNFLEKLKKEKKNKQTSKSNNDERMPRLGTTAYDDKKIKKKKHGDGDELVTCEKKNDYIRELSKEEKGIQGNNKNYENNRNTESNVKRNAIEVNEEEYINLNNTKKELQCNLSISEYAEYDYSKYQEDFLNNYSNNNMYDDDDDENNYLYFDNDNRSIYMKELFKHINNNCNKLIQIQNKIYFNTNQLQNCDKNRLILFHKFHTLINSYTEKHNIVVNFNSNINSLGCSKNNKFDSTQINKQKKIDLTNNLLFTVIIDAERDKDEIEMKLNNLRNETNTNNNNDRNRVKPNSMSVGKSPSTYEEEEYNSFFGHTGDINYDLLNDKITINEFRVLNDVQLYNKIVNVYKYGTDFFYCEHLRAVFWLWLQSIFSDNLDENENDEQENDEQTHIDHNHADFYDINNNQFFYDNIISSEKEDNMCIHILSDLSNFESNYKLLKGYIQEKGCTSGYNKIGNEDPLKDIVKYINNLHKEYEAFYNYKKRAKNLDEEMFVVFLEEKKKNMIISTNVEKEDYTHLASIVNKYLINIDKILKYNPILNFSNIIEGIKKENFIKPTIDINKIENDDWNNIHMYHKKNKTTLIKNVKNGEGKEGATTEANNDKRNTYIIDLASNSSYKIMTKPITYASTIFNYSDQLISSNDIYTFSDNIYKITENIDQIAEMKQHKCIHNFYHALRKVEKYMNCVAYNL